MTDKTLDPCGSDSSTELGMPASADERHLRRLLAVRVGMAGLYLDDGEASGQEHGISIDFMREPVTHIDAKLRALNVARAECGELSAERPCCGTLPGSRHRSTCESRSKKPNA